MIGLRFGDFFDFFAAGLRFEEDLRAAFTVFPPDGKAGTY
jgi:hypothetical protein